YIDYLKGEFFDFVYLQQNAFDKADEATTAERQKFVFGFIYKNILEKEFSFKNKEEALHFFQALRQLFRGWNSCIWQNAEFKKTEKEIQALINEKASSEKEVINA
ncbi:MAG: V-type ATP synthase subunit A, partial [Candidatus Omnitrophota bacterium]